MIIDTSYKRTPSYVGTFDLKSKDDIDAVKAIRKAMKGTGKRLKLQGRLGKNNPNAYKYKGKKGYYGSCICISLYDAARADGYIYDI